VHRARIWAKLGTPTQPLVAGLRLSAGAEERARSQHVTISLMTEPFPEQRGNPPLSVLVESHVPGTRRITWKNATGGDPALTKAAQESPSSPLHDRHGTNAYTPLSVCPGTSPPLLGTFQERAFLWWQLAAHHLLKPRHEAILATVEPRHERDECLPLWFEPRPFVTLFGLGKMGEGS
jgi:hypothetical protein